MITKGAMWGKIKVKWGVESDDPRCFYGTSFPALSMLLSNVIYNVHCRKWLLDEDD